MDLTKELVDEVVLAAQDVDYGSITVSITGPQNGKLVDIITEKRERYRQIIVTDPQTKAQTVKYQKDKY